jgi:hypothetical protein
VDVLIGWPGGDWQATARLAAGLVGAYLFLIWVASILWAYRDIRGRTRDPASQLIGVSIVTALPLAGLPIYLVVRPRDTLREAYDRQLEQEAILSELHSVPTCPQCRRPVDNDWAICAYCSHELKQPCASCSRLLLNAWRHCPYCSEPRQRAAEPVAPAPRLEVDEPPPLELQPERRRQRRAAASPQAAIEQPTPVPARPRAAAPDEHTR